jgi:N-acyl-D-aspartate/D-glutamate deacylase
VAARAIGILLGHQATMNPVNAAPTARRFADLPFDERIAALRDADVREDIVAEMAAHRGRWSWSRMFPLTDPPDYEPAPERSIAALAERAGTSPEAYAYDHLLGDGGTAMLYVPLLNYAGGNLDAVREMLQHEHTVVGLADGGAHVGTICDASFPTTLLTHWVRDRRRGDRLGLADVVAKQTSRTAAMVGLGDRGVLAPGRRADVNVIDLERLTLHPPVFRYDLPAGGKRLLQRAHGYLHTLVAGTETYTNGEHTGALPGRLVRGARPVPTA